VVRFTSKADNRTEKKVISVRLFERFSQSKIEIIPVKDFRNGLVFYVKNGKGLLCVKYGSSGDNGLCALTFDGIPLMKFHGDEYLCPTCEKFISAGYGLSMSKNRAIEELGEIFNAPFVNIQKSFNDLKPLFGLLPTGYYTLSDEELFPTDGQGNFFWNVSNNPTLNYATCPVYDRESFERSSVIPKYIFPTQSPKLFNKSRVEYYRAKEDTRAIAYYFNEGYLCALLDGHHKATAAALNAVPLKTLVIGGAGGFSFPYEPSGVKASIYFSNVTLYEDEMIESPDKTRKLWGVGNRMSDEEVARYLAMKNDDFDHVWSPDILKTASNYYDVYSLACVECAGDLASDRIDEILVDKKTYEESLIRHIAHALYVTKNQKFFEFAFFVCRNENYVHVWHDIFKLLANIKNQQVEDFFIEYLVNDEKLRPDITKIVDDYWATRKTADTL
jgi:hypothetical protein